MSKMKGPAIFLAQFAGDQAPFDKLANITRWAADLGYKGVQLPTWEAGLIDMAKADDSKSYCDELNGICTGNGVEITELSTHLQGQLLTVHPARWLPVLDGFDEAGVDLCYEIHPGEDLHDGVTFERFLEATGNHDRCHILYDPSHFVLQQLDYVQFIDFYHERIRMLHVIAGSDRDEASLRRILGLEGF